MRYVPLYIRRPPLHTRQATDRLPPERSRQVCSRPKILGTCHGLTPGLEDEPTQAAASRRHKTGLTVRYTEAKQEAVEFDPVEAVGGWV